MFITFEGIDGVGKTTQARMLHDFLKSSGVDVVCTKEPGGGGDFAMAIRKLLVEHNTCQLTDLFAIYAARNEHIKNVLKPALTSGKVVICDRFIDSTIAYFCYNKTHKEMLSARSLINAMQNYVAQGLKPDITFLIDAKYDIIRHRLERRSEGSDVKYDTFDVEKYNAIMDMYRQLQTDEPNRIIIINGNGSTTDIFKQIGNYIQKDTNN